MAVPVKVDQPIITRRRTIKAVEALGVWHEVWEEPPLGMLC